MGVIASINKIKAKIESACRVLIREGGEHAEAQNCTTRRNGA